MPNVAGSVDPLAPVRYADLVVLVLAAPFVLALGAPVVGYLVGTVAWFASRLIEARVQGIKSDDFKRTIGIGIGAMMGRTWLVGIAILATGVFVSRADGAAAAITCIVAFTLRLLTMLVTRQIDRAATA